MTKYLRVLRHLVVGLAAVAAMFTPLWFMIAALGGKFGFWEPLDGFRHVLTYAGLPGIGGGFLLPLTLGLGVIALGLVITYRYLFGPNNAAGPGGYVAAVLAIFVGATPMVLVVAGSGSRADIPPIHDITTDTQNPPQFTAGLIERRGEGSNSVDYASKVEPRSERPLPDVQAESYPDIQPMILGHDIERVYRASLEVAREMGWTIGTASDSEHAFEATATTFWFGFKDDVVVRIVETEAGQTRVDIRSVSRVGVSDLGANAARIAEFTGLLKSSLGEA